MSPLKTLSLAALLLSPLAACSAKDFPEDFAFGTAVAGFQVDMGCPTLAPEDCNDPRSDWYQFSTSTVTIAQKSNFLSGDSPLDGPGFIETYEADLDRMKDMGLSHFRFSLEWSRIFPEPTFGISGFDALKKAANPKGLAYYHQLLAAMKARNIKPMVTIHHYTLPVWMHDAVGCNQDLKNCNPKGWLDERIVTEIAKYAGFVAQEFGGEVDTWITQNEPFAVLLPGYIQPSQTRANPPSAGLQLDAAKTVLFHIIEAHAAMVNAIRASDLIDADEDGKATWVGLVHNYTPFVAKDEQNALDRLAALNLNHLFNSVLLDAVLLGKVDRNLDKTGQVEQDLVGKSDFIGFNYYTRPVVEGTDESIFPKFSRLATFNPLTLQQGAVYAKGIYDSLIYLRDTYPGFPIIITENGADVGLAPDLKGFLVEHLSWTAKALREDVPVTGYFYWYLMDNFEWNHGYHMKFGLFAVDHQDSSKTRTARPIVEAYQQIATERSISEALETQYPIEE